MPAPAFYAVPIRRKHNGDLCGHYVIAESDSGGKYRKVGLFPSCLLSVFEGVFALASGLAERDVY
jgi:hypothetical protein